MNAKPVSVFVVIGALLWSCALEAAPIRVRLMEGNFGGFLVVRSQDGAAIGYGEMSQKPTGNLVECRTILRFKDGSLYDESLTFSQKGVFRSSIRDQRRARQTRWARKSCTIDSGYDPHAMGQFFEKIQAEEGSGRQVEFFSNHPNPDNRIERVDQEVDQLGAAKRGAKTDSREFSSCRTIGWTLR